MNNYVRKISATNMFVLPILGIERGKLIRLGFIEAFIKDKMKEEQYENAVYLLFRPFKWEEFNLFVEEQREAGASIIDEYDYPDGYVVLVYQYPKKWQADVDIITLTGKYSTVTRAYKELVPKYHKVVRGEEEVEEMTTPWQIFTKSDKLRDYWRRELGLILTPEDEFHSYYYDREVLTQEKLNKYNFT